MNWKFLFHSFTHCKKKLVSFFVMVLLPLLAYSQKTNLLPVLKVDRQKLVSKADITYNEPVSRSEEGLPIGNGRMGSLVWTTPNMLRFQINRVDVFGNNSASDNFYERNSDYSGGLGFVDIDFQDFDEQVFNGDVFKEHLSCYNGEIEVRGERVRARITVANKLDVMAIEIEDNRPKPTAVNINLRMLRSPIARKGNHTALSKVKSKDHKIILTQKFTEDDYYDRSALVVGSTGREVRIRKTSKREIQLSVAPGKGEFSVFIGSAASFKPEDDVVDSALKQVDSAMTQHFNEISSSARQWWHAFWGKAFVQLHSDDDKADLIEKNYTYYLYVMASSSRGRYPAKFNGMLWTTGGDKRKWGSAYWGANQSCLYNALLTANHTELLNPMFNMYSSMYHSCALAAKQQWGSKGIFIPETVAFNGLPKLPDTVAHEMQALYLLKKPWNQRSETFKEYASTKMPYLSRWNWKSDQGWEDGEWHYASKGAGPFGHVTHIFSRGAKIAYQYWLKYEYLQDKGWLRDSAYPMLKGVAEFYRNFPNVQKENGKYQIYRVNDNESIWGGHNTIEEISAMKGIFSVAIKASRILNVDADLRQKWKSFLAELSPLPTRNDFLGDSSPQDSVWIKSLRPIIRGNGNRLPDPNTMPVWFFDLCTLESDSYMLKMANATYNAYFPKGINAKTHVNVLSKLPIAGVEIGRRAAARYLILNQIQTFETKVMPNRMDLREGYQTTSVERLGRVAEAMQKSLLQSVVPEPGGKAVIHVFPAWPTEWNAKYTLLARGNFLISSSMKEGKIEFVKILSRDGENCRLKNPWPQYAVTIYRDGEKWKTKNGNVLIFQTKKGMKYVIRRKETSIKKSRIR